MSPEQCKNAKTVDGRADIYSLGCILYEMLTGRPPFFDNAVSVVLARHMHDAPLALPAHGPTKLRSLVDKLLAKAPEERLQSAGEVRKVLEDVRESAPTIGTTATAPHPVQIPDTPDTMPDISPALAETATAAVTPPPSSRVTPLPAGMLVTATPETAAPTKGGAAPRRYAIVAFFAVIPLAILGFVMFNKSQSSHVPAATESGSNGTATTTSGSGAALANTPDKTPPAVVDAGVDAAPVVLPPVPADAGVAKPTHRPHPRTKPDAGTQSQLPDIDFIDVNKKK
jgi:serine/threonine-protein kinase